MAVTYQTEGVKMPDIKKRETTEWIKNVAASYGKRPFFLISNVVMP